MKLMDKEEFIEEIYSTPMWVRNIDDLYQYNTHISRRLIQSKAQNEKLLEFIEEILSEEDFFKINKILSDIHYYYEKLYEKYDPSLKTTDSFEMYFIKKEIKEI